MRFFNGMKYMLQVILLAAVLQGCDCIKGQLGMPTSSEIARMKQQMQIMEEQQKAIEERERFVRDSLAHAEQIAERAAVEGYHVIVGCFKDFSNAERMEKGLEDKGYKDAMQIPLKNGYMMVSLGSRDRLHEAVKLMEKAAEDTSIQYYEDIWVYGASMGLHKEN